MITKHAFVDAFYCLFKHPNYCQIISIFFGSPLLTNHIDFVVLSSSGLGMQTTTRLGKSISKLSTSVSRRLDFYDSRAGLQNKTTAELVRALAVFQISQIKPIVAHSEALVKFSYSVFGSKFTDKMMKKTFFGHFCGGETTAELEPTIRALADNGIGSILDYAAEADVVKSPEKLEKLVAYGVEQKVTAQMYDYTNESTCDHHVETFKHCIAAAKASSAPNAKCFAAIKVTALGDPALLRAISTTLNEFQTVFNERINVGDEDYVTKEGFRTAFMSMFTGGDAEADALFAKLDHDGDGRIDLIDWMHNMPIETLHELTAHCKNTNGKLSNAILNDEERRLYANMKRRLKELADMAQELGVRIMIDAEQTYFQPAIDHLTHRLMVVYNDKKGSYPVIFGTYQMYLKDSEYRLHRDMDRAERYGYRFAAKLVRGAYMTGETVHMREIKSDYYPIHPTVEDTHLNYNHAITSVFKRIRDFQKQQQQEKQSENLHHAPQLEIMLASHNQYSMAHAVKEMAKFDLSPADSGVYFGQLLGMSDHLTYTLGVHGYRPYKYVPFGKVSEVMPYLIRRAVENADALGGAKLEIKMLKGELWRRLTTKGE